jgi:hypothetical protein
MNVLQPTNNAQTLTFIPRYQVATVDIFLFDKFKDKNYTFTGITATYQNGLMSIEISHDFKEGDTYSYQVNDPDGKLLFRGQIYITAQDTQEFDLTKDDFIYG